MQGKGKSPAPGLLFLGVLSSSREKRDAAQKKCQQKWGELLLSFSPIPFHFTTYYDKEMGAPIFREFWAFPRLVPLDTLPTLKRETVTMERELAENEKRRVNLDPGVLTLAKVILLSTKDFVHRVYLGEGIFAEVTLFFREGKFKCTPWTYPDYREASVRSWFLKLRNLYKQEMEKQRKEKEEGNN